jgi:hypothetical protein
LCGDRGGLSLQAAVGEANDPVTRRLKSRIALPIALEGRPVAMEGEAIQLSDESLFQPERIDLEAE